MTKNRCINPLSIDESVANAKIIPQTHQKGKNLQPPHGEKKGKMKPFRFAIMPSPHYIIALQATTV